MNEELKGNETETETGKEIAQRPIERSNIPMDVTKKSMDISELKDRMTTIKKVIKDVMVEDVHYGQIPGTKKVSLLKAGAEKLGAMFMLMPSYRITRTDFDDGHREYEIICTLKQVGTGAFAGEGVGCCSTRETKYAYKWIVTEKKVPGQYWHHRNPELIGGDGFGTIKINKDWFIKERKERRDLADAYNTVLKMAKKRAHIDSILTAIGASDAFSMDLMDDDDIDHVDKMMKDVKKEKKTKKESKQIKTDKEERDIYFDEVLTPARSHYLDTKQNGEPEIIEMFKKINPDVKSYDDLKLPELKLFVAGIKKIVAARKIEPETASPEPETPPQKPAPEEKAPETKPEPDNTSEDDIQDKMLAKVISNIEEKLNKMVDIINPDVGKAEREMDKLMFLNSIDGMEFENVDDFKKMDIGSLYKIDLTVQDNIDELKKQQNK